MKKRTTFILAIVAGAAILIQLIPSGRPSNNPVSGKDIASSVEVPASVYTLLKNACFDCHSQSSRFPWYSYVAPVSWLVASDINKAREQLDFSYWGDLSLKDKIKMLDDISEEVSEKEMPLESYKLMHPSARLTDEECEIIVEWTESVSEKLME
jgi:hypothetical protein